MQAAEIGRSAEASFRKIPTTLVRRLISALLKAGDPRGEVATAFHAKEAVRELYGHNDTELALEFVQDLAGDIDNEEQPVEARSLGHTLKRWKHQIATWEAAHVSSGLTEAANNLIKRVKRAAFGFTSFRNYRIRARPLRGQAQPITARNDQTPPLRSEQPPKAMHWADS
jgi:hypothetical protein